MIANANFFSDLWQNYRYINALRNIAKNRKVHGYGVRFEISQKQSELAIKEADIYESLFRKKISDVLKNLDEISK